MHKVNPNKVRFTTLFQQNEISAFLFPKFVSHFWMSVRLHQSFQVVHGLFDYVHTILAFFSMGLRSCFKIIFIFEKSLQPNQIWMTKAICSKTKLRSVFASVIHSPNCQSKRTQIKLQGLCRWNLFYLKAVFGLIKQIVNKVQRRITVSTKFNFLYWVCNQIAGGQSKRWSSPRTIPILAQKMMLSQQIILLGKTMSKMKPSALVSLFCTAISKQTAKKKPKHFFIMRSSTSAMRSRKCPLINKCKNKDFGMRSQLLHAKHEASVDFFQNTTHKHNQSSRI